MYLLFAGCSKEGTGGKATIQGMVKHHSDPIPGAVIYIKYGAEESPGTDITYYDASATGDANAHYEFSDLKKGDYYLFAVGFDSNIVQTVIGGIPVEIKSKTETVTADVPVTE
ncbi:MAG: carboxypeptidase regulatory-like domain-containing protein [Bacteroidetes bacterium]|nr:MAG: carboxypeptidase regulatory-like domain-containing protein [Bacteroidota bacterium]